jgi:hypothetical protein
MAHPASPPSPSHIVNDKMPFNGQSARAQNGPYARMGSFLTRCVAPASKYGLKAAARRAHGACLPLEAARLIYC